MIGKHVCVNVRIRTLEMEVPFLRSMWPSFPWRWAGRRRHPMHLQFRSTQKARSNMMQLPVKDKGKKRYLSCSSMPLVQNFVKPRKRVHNMFKEVKAAWYVHEILHIYCICDISHRDLVELIVGHFYCFVYFCNHPW